MSIQVSQAAKVVTSIHLCVQIDNPFGANI